MDDHKLHSHLKSLVSSKSGALLSRDDPYRKISEEIFKETKNYISENTVRRFFQVDSVRVVTPFVLNSMVQYLGFSRWESFLEDILKNS